MNIGDVVAKRADRHRHDPRRVLLGTVVAGPPGIRLRGHRVWVCWMLTGRTSSESIYSLTVYSRPE